MVSRRPKTEHRVMSDEEINAALSKNHFMLSDLIIRIFIKEFLFSLTTYNINMFLSTRWEMDYITICAILKLLFKNPKQMGYFLEKSILPFLIFIIDRNPSHFFFVISYDNFLKKHYPVLYILMILFIFTL